MSDNDPQVRRRALLACAQQIADMAANEKRPLTRNESDEIGTAVAEARELRLSYDCDPLPGERITDPAALMAVDPDFGPGAYGHETAPDGIPRRPGGRRTYESLFGHALRGQWIQIPR